MPFGKVRSGSSEWIGGHSDVGLSAGTPINSKSTTVRLRTVPLTIGITPPDEFAVIDQRRPAGQQALYTPAGTHPGTVYGLLTVLTGTDQNGKRRRTLQLTGTGSSGALQGAVRYFCSAESMWDLKQRMGGFPPNYQVVVRCTVSGFRLISYRYETHVVVDRPLEAGLRRFCELAVFDARLYIQVRRVDQPA